MDGLRKCIYSGQCYTKIKETSSEDNNDIIDLSEEQPKFTLETTSKTQLDRVMVQCITVLNMLQLLNDKNSSEVYMLEQFQYDLNSKTLDKCEREEMFKVHEVAKLSFRSKNTIPVLSEKVRDNTGTSISARRVREWYAEYFEKECFEEDLRGGWQRDMFLEEFGYSVRFQLYLKNEKKLTVDVATKELESIITKDPPKTEEGKEAFENLRPFTKRTVHRWIIRLGCKYEKATVSYYTDKKDMRERYEKDS